MGRDSFNTCICFEDNWQSKFVADAERLQDLVNAYASSVVGDKDYFDGECRLWLQLL
jgi:hypothetical protein